MTELVIADLAPFERLAFFPFNDIHAAFLVSISDARGVVDLSTPRALQAWYRDQLDLDPRLPDNLLRLLNDGFSPEDDDRHKLEVIYDFVRSEIRYLADARGSFAYLPHDPAYTLERRYGDCKDRAYALYSIARAFGIDVDMALVATEPRPRFRGTNLGTFDHMICAYEDSGTVHYFDPTCRYCEFGNLPSHEIGAQVLRLTESATWPATISRPPRRPSLQVSIKGSIDSSVVRADITLRNDDAFVMREAKATLPAVEFENIASALINGNFNALTLSRFEWLDDRDDCVLLQASADLSTFRIETEAKIYLPKTPFRVLGSDVLERAGDEALVLLDSPASIVLDLDLALGGHTVQPDELLLGQRGSLWLSAKASVDGARLRLEYRMIQSETIFEVETKQQLMTFLEQIAKSRPAMFTITKRQS
jgi:hypothetical protein